MYNTYKAILRKKGLSEKQIKTLAEAEDKVFSLGHKRLIVDRKYNKAMDRWRKLSEEYGV